MADPGLPSLPPQAPRRDEKTEPEEIIQALVKRYSGPPDPLITEEGAFTALETLNANASSAVYSPLREGEVRLVQLYAGTGNDHLVCSVAAVKREATSPYTALSYVWGSQARPAIITLNGSPYYITRNLETALSQLRLPDQTVLLWIDALAINQTDIPERNDQVGMMRDIYSSASETVICLDPEQDAGTSCFLELLECLHDEPATVKHIPGYPWPIWLGRAITKFRGLTYWSRIWVIQEVSFSHQVGIVHQRRTRPYNTIKHGWEILTAHFEALPMGGTDLESQAESTMRRSEMIRYMKSFGPMELPHPGTASIPGSEISLGHWTAQVYYKRSTDPRDTVFGYHGCFSPSIRAAIKIDYGATLDQVWADMTRLIIKETESLDVILGQYNFERTLPHLPSWVPQWTEDTRTPHFYTAVGFHLETGARGFAAGGRTLPPGACDSTFPLGRTLSVSGYEIGRVVIVAQPSLWEQRVNSQTELVEQLMSATPDKLDNYFHHVRRNCGVNDANEVEFAEFIEAFAADKGTPGWQIANSLAGQSTLIPEREDSWAVRLAHLGRSLCSYRRIAMDSAEEVASKVGYCLGVDSLVPGDKICVLLGCSVPVALREDGEHHVLVGDIYVPGCMMGEVLAEPERPKGVFRTFSIA